MRLDQQIRINEFLLQREELFLRIHAAETEINRLLGEPWPFTRPPLPSDRRAKRKASGAAATGSSSSAAAKPRSPADSLRRLDEGESAYRVTYRQFGRTVTEVHHDFAALSTLLACQSGQLQVERIETLDATGAPKTALL